MTKPFVTSIVGLIAVASLVAAVEIGASIATQPEAIAESEKPEKVTLVAEEEPEQVGEDPNEDFLITQALIEQGYFREDVPLSFDLQDTLHTACAEFDVDYELMLALIERESQFQNVVGDGGDSVGYCQIQERWWGWLMEEIGADDLTDPVDNLQTGCAIMGHLLDRYGNERDALSAYNTGSPGYTEYASTVLAGAEKWVS